jgi:glycosyltransferase involved in cell wall biosynthesis
VKLVVTIPAYNEENTIADVIAEIPREIDGIDTVEVLLIDDGSTDGTVKKAREAGVNNIISHKKNKGLGLTFRDGLDAALEMGADIIVNIDGDGQYNAQETSALVKPLLENKADIALGWRDIDRLSFMPRGKKLGNKIATRLTSMVSGIPIKDAQSGFRAFSREAALRMNLSGKYTYVQETIIEAKYKGLKFEQVPIEFRARQGKSRLIPNLTTYARRAGAIIIGTYWNYHPLKIFSLIGIFLIIIGVVLGAITLFNFIQDGTISDYTSTAIFAAILSFIGLQTIILGLFANAIKSLRLLQAETLYRLKKQTSTPPKEH